MWAAQVEPALRIRRRSCRRSTYHSPIRRVTIHLWTDVTSDRAACGTMQGAAGGARRPAGSRPRLGAAAGTAAPRHRVAGGMAAAGPAAAAYMVFEAQWVRVPPRPTSRCRVCPPPGRASRSCILPTSTPGPSTSTSAAWPKWCDWAEPLDPRPGLLTGDNLGDPERSRTLSRAALPGCSPLWASSRSPATTSTASARARSPDHATPGRLWTEAGITLLCRLLRGAARRARAPRSCSAAPTTSAADTARPPPARRAGEPPLAPSIGRHGRHLPDPARPRTTRGRFTPVRPLPARIRRPYPRRPATHDHAVRPRVVSREGHGYLPESTPGEREHWSSPGASAPASCPSALLTRPEATLWRLVYTSYGSQSSQTNLDQGDAHD